MLALPLLAASSFVLLPTPVVMAVVLPFRLPPGVMASLAGLGGAGPVPPLPPTPPRRPLAPLRSLLCIGLNEASPRPAPTPLLPPPVGTGVLDAPRPLLARPFGARDSASLVGESQNLHKHNVGVKNNFKKSIVNTSVEPSRFWCNPSEFQRTFSLST